MSSHGHSNAPGPGAEVEAPASPRVRRMIVLLLVPIVALTVVGMVVLWPADVPSGPDVLGVAADRQRGTVQGVSRRECLPGGPEQPGGGGGPSCPVASVKLTTGPQDGSTVEALIPEGEGAPTFERGDRVVVAFIEAAPEGQQYEVVDYQRGRPLVLLAIAFAVLVVVTARWRGLAALVGLAVSGVILLAFIVPAILAGESPLLVAVVGSSAIMLVALFLAHGFTVRTAVAVLGTTASLALTAVLAYVVVSVSHFSGLGSEDTAFLRSAFGDIDMQGLLLAGIVIGSLGVLDDVTVTQTSVVWEVAHANRALDARHVYLAGSRVGRDHVASTVNTLALAYAGAALPLLLLFTISSADGQDVLTTELVAQEVVRTLVGGIGIVAAVPLTTALATLFAVADRGRTVTGRRRGRAVSQRPAGR